LLVRAAEFSLCHSGEPLKGLDAVTGGGNKVDTPGVLTMDDRRRRFEALVLPHLDAAYRFARWLSRSPSDADDVVQEAILRAFRGFDALRGSDVKAWLLTIVKNCHLTAVKQQQRRALVPLPEEHDVQDGQAMIATTPDPESTSIRRDEERTLDRLMSALPEEHREVLVLREIEEMDYREIATVTNVPIGTVMSRLARARAALKARWLQEAEGEPHAMR
jgi:RNA polymerase sigma factor (sigma-70 family)